ncbi:MAG: 50S ribosomal protein L5 [Phycisphaerae bacterium]|nr:50S ribosomal protein L5 [Phycisphaerae bacterium]
MPRLQEKYRNDVAPALQERFAYKNALQVPRLSKITVSMGIGEAHSEDAKLEEAQKHLARITGQKPIVTRARRAVSNFKVRRGMKVGLKVTLRRSRMYEFLDRLVTLAIPRVKDFRGLSASSFDGRGSYNMGLVEQSVFPEIDPNSISHTQGMNIAITTTAKTDEEARELLRRMGMPLQSE